MKPSSIILVSVALCLASCGPKSDNTSRSLENNIKIETQTPAIKTVISTHEFSETVARVEQAIANRPLNLFAKIDHSAGAEKAELSLSPSTLFIFGNPKGGTPLMQRNPTMGIVLPLKLHVYQEGDSVKLSYIDIESEAKLHGLDISKQPIPNISKMLEGLIAEVAQ